MRRAALLVAVLVSAAFAGGCGGDSQDTSATTEWADGVCSAFSTWTSSVGAAARSFTTATPSQEGLETAVGDVKDATSTFADDLKGLGAPDTESGEKAKDELDGLADDLEEDADKIEDAADDVSGLTDVLSAVSAISGTLATMTNQVSATFDELKRLDTRGELSDAFDESDSCSTIRTTTS